MWEYANNHVLLVFRLYYQGDQLIPVNSTLFPAPVLMVNLDMIRKQPRDAAGSAVATRSLPVIATTVSHNNNDEKDDKDKDEKERRTTLQEVREHLELLKEFEGIIPEEEIAQRKRDLFLSMPPIPALPKRHKRVASGEVNVWNNNVNEYN